MATCACEAAHSSPPPTRCCTSAVRADQPTNPYSRATISCASRFESGSLARGNCAWTRAMASPFPAATSRASLLACLRSESTDGRAGRSRAADIAPPFTDRLYPLRDQAERRCTAPHFRPRQVGILPLPRVGGALSGALERSIAGTGSHVKRHVRASGASLYAHRHYRTASSSVLEANVAAVLLPRPLQEPPL